MEQNPIDVARILLSFSAEEIEDTYSLENLRYLHTVLTGFPPALHIQSKYVLTRVLLSTARYIMETAVPRLSKWDMLKISIELSINELDRIDTDSTNENKIAMMSAALTGLLEIANDLSEIE